MWKKAKELTPKLSKKLNLSEELVNDIIDFYYSELRKKIESLDVDRIRVPGLGVFYVSQNKLKTSIDTISYLMQSDKEKDFKTISKYNLNKTVLDKQIKLLELIKNNTHEQIVKKNLEK
ncbi:MAG TPA: hypothetical protein VMZ91_07325 [Candidatus Paceibacterota bacterium]|nr:hypothetical protein [Candidatus Paceibacterota bacterium]